MKFKKILVPVDFSSISDNAVDHALFWAEKFDAQITLVHVSVLFQSEAGEEKQLQEYEKFVENKDKECLKQLQLLNNKAEKRGVAIDSELLRGFSAADAILEFIGDNDYDLIVIGTHGYSGFKEWIYGSVAERVVRLSPIPVLTTYQEFKKADAKNILVPVDFSEYSQKAVKRAISIGQQFGASLTFLHVVEQGFHPAFYAADIESIFQIDSGLKGRVIQKLTEFTGVATNDAVYAVAEGKPHKAIKKYAAENKSDLIVMATRGLSGLEQFLVGSNAERVVCIAPCPVLTVGRSK